MSSSVAALQKRFISSPTFSVLGASSDRAKYGNKVLRWYQSRGLPVTPINPKLDEIEGVQTLRDLKSLPSPRSTSLSIITPPSVTLSALQLVKELEIPTVWIQPGAEDETVSEYIAANLPDRVIYGGPCILVQGDSLLASLKSVSDQPDESNGSSTNLGETGEAASGDSSRL